MRTRESQHTGFGRPMIFRTIGLRVNLLLIVGPDHLAHLSHLDLANLCHRLNGFGAEKKKSTARPNYSSASECVWRKSKLALILFVSLGKWDDSEQLRQATEVPMTLREH